jgi:hypothetical protein
MDGLLLPALIVLLVLALTALAAGAESRDGFAITDERPLAPH